ncbi:hypothetical protein M446_6077 [Methylobacterium sp. 4-46]|uniref:hypothetical protein n=1 Tax=unclassified Methylobacterium TaxID=2615210 RepID=UPI000165CCC1|nr:MULTISPECIES: hypothetical protein [Methylobacterium]ACA20353.1 hypothetical protein M446_6077 [Methylobacterium sp. 4-46]WFT79524.1 hypothetical protein QA634_30665 [Methylobacterium nodulans]
MNDIVSSELRTRIQRAKCDIEECLRSGDPAATFRGLGRGPEIWIAALDEIFDEWPLREAERAAALLHETLPAAEYLSTVTMLLGAAPPAEAHEPEIEPRDFQSVLIARHSDAVGTVVAFTGMKGRLGMPLKIADRWFSAARLNRIYLRDANKDFFLGGLKDLGGSFEESVLSLRRTIDAFGGGRLFLFGGSAGGYPALRYALALEAQAVLVFSGATNITRSFVGDAVDRYGAREQPDLRPAYAAAAHPPRVRLVYAAGHAMDALQAGNFKDLPGVICDPLPDCTTHITIPEAVRTGKYGGLLAWLFECDRPKPGANPDAVVGHDTLSGRSRPDSV